MKAFNLSLFSHLYEITLNVTSSSEILELYRPQSFQSELSLPPFTAAPAPLNNQIKVLTLQPNITQRTLLPIHLLILPHLLSHR